MWHNEGEDTLNIYVQTIIHMQKTDFHINIRKYNVHTWQQKHESDSLISIICMLIIKSVRAHPNYQTSGSDLRRAIALARHRAPKCCTRRVIFSAPWSTHKQTRSKESDFSLSYSSLCPPKESDLSLSCHFQNLSTAKHNTHPSNTMDMVSIPYVSNLLSMAIHQLGNTNKDKAPDSTW